MKKKLFLAIVFVLAIIFVSYTFLWKYTFEHEKKYNTHPIEVTSEQKCIHVKNAKRQYENTSIQNITKEERNSIIVQAVFSKLISRKSVDLGQYGIYEMSVENATNDLQREDIEMTEPLLFYDVKHKEWIVVCAGAWKKSQNRILNGNIGEREFFGVELVTKENQFTSSVLDSYAFIADEKMENVVSTELRTDGDVGNGFIFGIQDYVSGTFINGTYVGSCWYGMCIYDENFSSFDCTMKSIYIHTF